MAHKFKVGQIVDLEPNILRSLAPTRHEISHLLPSSDRDPHNPRYRIKSISEAHARVAAENEFTLSTDPSPEFIEGTSKSALVRTETES